MRAKQSNSFSAKKMSREEVRAALREAALQLTRRILEQSRPAEPRLKIFRA